MRPKILDYVNKIITSTLIAFLICLSFPMTVFAEDNDLQIVKLQLRWDNQFQFAGYYAADWQGYYAEEGIKVEIISAIKGDQSFLSSVKEVSEGRADFGIGSSDILIANDNGADLRIVAVIMQNSAARFYLKQDTKYTNLSDLTKLKVARNVNDLIDIELQAMLAKEGIDPNLIKAYPHQNGMDHLITDEVQVIPGYVLGVQYSANQKGISIKEINPQEYGVDFYGDSLFVNGTLIDKNPELVEKFKRASMKGWEYAFNHSEEIALKISQELNNFGGFSDLLDFNLYQAQIMKELANYPVVEVGHINPYRWQKMIDFLKKEDLIEKDVDINQLIYDPVRLNIEKSKQWNDLLISFGLGTVGLLFLLGFRALLLNRTVKRKTEEIISTQNELRASEKKYRLITENGNDVITIYNIPKNVHTYISPAVQKMRGFTPEEAKKLKFEDSIDPDLIDFTISMFTKNMNDFLYNPQTTNNYRYETRQSCKNGEYIWVEVSSIYQYNEENELETINSLRNIEDRKKSEVQLKQNMNDLLISQRIAHLGTWRLDLATNQALYSEELNKMYGFDPTMPPLVYTEVMKFYTSESWEKLSISLEHTSTTGIPYELELETLRKDQSNGWMWVRGEAEKDTNGNIVSIHGVAQDITERKKAERELHYLANHDSLTSLYNRRFFEEELQNLDIEQNLPISIIMCDVNGLKLINDSFGHHEGDKLLKKASDIIKKVCREKDVIARIGGDEFIILLPKTIAEESSEIANRIKELASKENFMNIELSISYGYDTKISENQSISEIIANSENYMFRHKLFERSSMRSKTTNLIMNTLFEKSHREAAHSNRVSKICEVIASKMNMDKVAVNQMKIAGLIHDIGKIGIDEKILNKPGALTIKERSEIERHPEIGWRILSATSEFSQLALFILAHHEKWDGSGYPKGLKGESIPLESRIIAVADAYDAMTSERSYRKAMSKEEAIKELKRFSGIQFDPNIVEVFINIE